MLPASVHIEDWIDPLHLQTKTPWITNEPFEHCIVPNFFKANVFQALQEFCNNMQPEEFDQHPTGSYHYAALADESFYRFMYSENLKHFLKDKLDLQLIPCRAFPCPQVYQFTDPKSGLIVHNDFNPAERRDFGMILYIHPHWKPEYGGELQLYGAENHSNPLCTIPPHPNSMIGFRVSPISFHGVRPSTNAWGRKSIVIDYNIFNQK